jgi:ACS family tartrate transporter-like MFS transporter
LLSLANIGLFACAFGFLFFLPLIVKAMGGSVLRAGLLSAIPYVAATVATLVMGYQADRTASPEKLVFAATATLALGLAGSAWLGTSAWSLLTLSIAAAGLFAFLPTFWAIPGRHLTGAAAAAGIALINSLGSLGGFIGPSIFGWLADRTGGFSGALGLLAAWAVVSGFLVLASRPRAATATEDKP